MSLETFVNQDAPLLTAARCQSATDLGAIPFKAQASGDKVSIDLFLTGNDGLINLQDFVEVRLGLGNLNARPESGTYTFDSLASPLAWNHDDAALQTAIAAEVAACAVVTLSEFVFKVTFDSVGAQVLPVFDPSELEPTSTVNAVRLVDGDGSTREVWLWRIFRNPIASTIVWANNGAFGLSGTLSLSTEGIYDLLGTKTSAGTFIELELIDSSGNITTVMQQPYTIVGEVTQQGFNGPVDFEDLIPLGQLNISGNRGNLIFVDSVYGDDFQGRRQSEDLAYLTCTAALADAQAGDLIVVFPGDYSADPEIPGKAGVNWKFLPGSIAPVFFSDSVGGFDIDGYNGKLISISAASAVDAVTIRNAKIDLEEDAAIPFAFSGLVTNGPVDVKVYDSKITNLDGITNSASTNLTAGIGYFAGGGGLLLLSNVIIHVIKTTSEGSGVGATGIFIGKSTAQSIPPNLQVKNCTIVTDNQSVGTNESISLAIFEDATVHVQGTLSQTNAPQSAITFDGGDVFTNPDFSA